MSEDQSLAWFEVGAVEQLKKSKCRRLYTESGNDLALFCIKEGEFHATSAVCPHAGGPIDQGDIEEQGSTVKVTCPMHFYVFDVKNGSSITGLKLPIFETEIRDDGQLYIKTTERVSLKYVKTAK
ncbi:assimilatory nitrite reductase [NAD(P)H] small subunit-like [Babylonia areolata]|uniref:assimilatory nitrite reductase [NAD(P)H] small subunit-like n=1 Tax=Babylonia areolata TaxID=304850 RepID=UPI003FD4B12D